jgi:hypothetical protein
MQKFLVDRCEICGGTIADLSRFPPEIQAEIYKPSREELGIVEMTFDANHRAEITRRPLEE